MSDRTSLLKLLEAVNKHEMALEPREEESSELWDLACSIRAELDAQEKAEWEAAYPHEKAFGGSEETSK